MALRAPMLAMLLALALLPFVAAPAEAQVFRSMLTLSLAAPEEVFTSQTPSITLAGTTTYTGDPGTHLRTGGVPIVYTVSKAPGWLSVVVTPTSDVIPTTGMPTSVTVTATRTFHVTATLDPLFVGQAADQIEITVTQPPDAFFSAAEAKNAIPIVADVEETPCEAHDEQLLALAGQAAEAYARERASGAVDAGDVGAGRPGGSEPELITQDTSSRPLAPPWIVVAGFALVGAGIGLTLRRRLAR